MGQKPTILPIIPSCPTFHLERETVREAFLKVAPDFLKVIGVNDPDAKVVCLRFFQIQTGVSKRRLVRIHDFDVRSEDMDQCRYGIDSPSEFLFVLTQPLFGPFALIDVCGLSVPLHEFSRSVIERRGAMREPTIFSIEAPYARFHLTWLAGC